MKFESNEQGNLVLTFDSPINLERSASPVLERVSDKAQSTMELFANDNGTPTGIEWIVQELDLYEFIGLWFDGKTLTDYDGVFELPKQAIKLIRKAGYKVPKDFEI
jgi:hypothetical protein